MIQYLFVVEGLDGSWVDGVQVSRVCASGFGELGMYWWVL